jgi:predicted ATPase/DNA-binding winged helix-turn-helix (wHTH) protein
MAAPTTENRDVISFGPFNLARRERLLTRGGAPVDLGGRTLDLLIALVSRPNEIISKKDLLASVWPDVTVEEGSLRLQITKLRKVLGDGKGGARYVATVGGRGYTFVAPIKRSSEPGSAHAAVAPPVLHANLPARLTRMVGRSDDTKAVSTQLKWTRFVTIVGSGGIGKTTVAVAVAHDLIEQFAGAALFFDLGALSDPSLISVSLASMLGLSVPSDDATTSLIAYIRDKRILLILDTCEHLIDAVAELATRIFVAAPEVHILASSREALRVEGEHIYKLAALAYPPNNSDLTSATIQTFPAVQLFLERAAAGGARLDLTDADAAIVAGICRKLDGVALAIELAAGRVEAYGLQKTAALLDERLSMRWLGQRTAPARQKTLHAMLDWSYKLLSESERAVLRRIAIFVGDFSMEAALAVVTSAAIDRAVVLAAIESLVAKSMLATRSFEAMMRYRLLDTTRAYALEIKADDSELADLAARHALYYERWLEQTGAEWLILSTAAERAPHLASIGNVRAALEWCFGVSGRAEIGVRLAAAAAPSFLAMSLLTECQRWSERAILALDEITRGGPEEMHLQAALGMSLMFTGGQSEVAREALNRGVKIAEACCDLANQLQLLCQLHMFHHRLGDFKIALDYAKRSTAVAGTIASTAAVALAQSQMGISLNYLGDLGRARVELEACLQHGSGSRRTSTILHGFDHYIITGGYLARTLWLQGHPAQAVERARMAVRDAAGMDHPVTLSIALIWAVSVFLWIGDLRSAQEHVDWSISHARSHSLVPYLAAAVCFEGELAIRRGNAGDGVRKLRDSLEKLHAARYELLVSAFNISLVEGLVASGRCAESFARVDEAIRRVETKGDLSYMPELLRVKGSLFLSKPERSIENAEACFTRSLELSRLQGARAWELRTATDLAALWAALRKPKTGLALLQPVYEQFTEGFDTVDLKAARRLLARLG